MRCLSSGGRFWVVPVVLSAALAIGCRESSRKPGAAPVQSTAAKIGVTPTDEECRAFATEMAAAVQSGEVAQIDQLIDYDAILESATGGTPPGAEQFRRNFVAGAKTTMASQAGLGGAIQQAVGQGGHFDFLRIAIVDGKKLVRFRLLLPNGGGVSYFDVIVTKDPAGRVRSLDVYTYATGDTIAARIRPLYLAALAQYSKSVFAKMSKSDQEYARDATRLQTMATSFRAGDSRRVLDTYASLTPEFQKNKTALIMRLQAAVNLSDAEQVARAMADLNRFHRNDPCIALLSIDHYILQKDFDKALANVDRLDKGIGGDPYLNVLRAYINVAKGNGEEAKRLAKKALDAEPELRTMCPDLFVAIPGL